MLKNVNRTSKDETISSRAAITPEARADAQAKIEKIIAHLNGGAVPSDATAPWILQQFLAGEIDLDAELAQRFRTMPLMPSIRFRTVGGAGGLYVATLTTQDDAAHLIVEAEAATGAVQFTFVYGSMLSLRFRLDRLTPGDRAQWLEWMRREQGGLAFLWSQQRWEQHYVICNVTRYYTSLYAFSPRGFEAAARLTPVVMTRLLDWLEALWQIEPVGADDAGLGGW